MKKIFSLLLLGCFSISVWAQPKVVAHRGYWDITGSSQNSITALQKAGEIKCYGSEFDVSITQDGVAVVNHDSTIKGILIETANYADIKDIRLSNGELLPTLSQYLSASMAYPEMQLILEIKPHQQEINESRAVDAVVDLVKRYHLEKRVEFISFSLHICKRLHEQMPDSKVAYLNGELSPLQVKELGLTGIDYQHTVLNKHPEWLDEAAQNQVEVNVWTVNEEKMLRQFADDKRVQLITTNAPVLLQTIIQSK